MKIKFILIFLFIFVVVNSRSHGGKGYGKMDNLEEVCQIKQKLGIIEKEMKKLHINYVGCN
ncbi:unnamed protein product [Meloidogyne enterolobii]|uniref:Uncharacterized protein n=1 Tax=Meloidogyne enterolobii TaxID=390850 RepID=A0ACB0Z5D2_MELEN